MKSPGFLSRRAARGGDFPFLERITCWPATLGPDICVADRNPSHPHVTGSCSADPIALLFARTLIRPGWGATLVALHPTCQRRVAPVLSATSFLAYAIFCESGNPPGVFMGMSWPPTHSTRAPKCVLCLPESVVYSASPLHLPGF